MSAKIIDRGRGPEIEGTRITVYDVMDYLQEGWRYDQIAGLFRLLPDDIQAAIQYIEAHYAEVMADYQQILARHSQVQYPPEVQAKLARSREAGLNSPRSGHAIRVRTRMPAIMADHDIEGQVRALLRLLTSAAWYEIWHGLAMRVESFTSLGLPENTPDAALWQFCQTQQIILITGNRNKAGTDALEAVIEQNNTPQACQS